jgi:glycosyltransferase involved in cell wall biosynthesis
MKISLINDTIYRYASGDPSAVGGAERYMWLLTRAMAARGWSATIGVPSALEPGERAEIHGVRFVGLERSHLVRAFSAFLAAERPDWCHWFGADHLLGPLVAVAKLAGTRTVFSAQFDLDVHPRHALYRRPRLWPLYAAGLAGSSRIFLQHQRQLAELPARWRPKSTTVPGIVEPAADFVPHGDRRPYVSWVGVLRQPKRPDLLIEIARRLPSIEFVVCGGVSAHRSPPGYGDMMRKTLETVPNIRYLGHVAPDRAIDVIARSALLLSTSEREGFPSVFLEAWAHGTPVVSLGVDPDGCIATRRLGVVSNGVGAAADDITALVASADRRQEAALRCRAHVAAAHSADAAVAIVKRALAMGGAHPAAEASPHVAERA